MLSRKTLAPSCTSCRSVSGFSLAGPSVQMILVLRISSVRFGYSCFIFPPGRKGKIKTARMKRQVWAVIGIAQNLRAPFFLHVAGFAEQTLAILRAPHLTTGGGFVVNQVRVRCPGHKQTALPQTQAEIDVIEITGKIFIEAAEIGKNSFARHHAGSSNGGGIWCQKKGAVHRGDGLRWETMKGVARHSIQAKDDSAMLQSSIRIPKSGPDCAHFRAQSVADHLPQPVSFLRFNVVVQERQNLTAR